MCFSLSTSAALNQTTVSAKQIGSVHATKQSNHGWTKYTRLIFKFIIFECPANNLEKIPLTLGSKKVLPPLWLGGADGTISLHLFFC